jgi:acyl carrier protein
MSTEERLQQILGEIFLDDSITFTDETTAADVPGWDSLRHINLMFAVEQEFDVRFSERQFHDFETVGDLRRFLEGRG